MIKYVNGIASFLTHDEFCNRFGAVNEFEYTSLKHVITVAMQKVGYSLNRADYRDIHCPYLPSFIHLINLSQKGCSPWTKILRKNKISQNIRKFETNWETSLGAIQGINFWDRCYRNVQLLTFNSKLKWFYYQIVRGCLKTNRIVTHIKRNIPPECTFCRIEVETISHLFWECNVVKTFIDQCLNYVLNRFPVMYHHFNKSQFLFGLCENICSPKNYLALHIKYFIWLQRCNKTNPNLDKFKGWWLREIRIDANNKYDKRLFFLSEILNENDGNNFNFVV